MTISDEMKKIFLAGIGAIATTAEKTMEVIDSLIEKGELTVEQGRVINEELKHNMLEIKKEHSAETETRQMLKRYKEMNETEKEVFRKEIMEMENKRNESGKDND
ncbi:MAG: aspartyl beta-hydroxylase [Dehalobacter sp. 4CP]|nr:aspartyl beta-hydroxylase [Dehalobacter sp. 4CP]